MLAIIFHARTQLASTCQCTPAGLKALPVDPPYLRKGINKSIKGGKAGLCNVDKVGERQSAVFSLLD